MYICSGAKVGGGGGSQPSMNFGRMGEYILTPRDFEIEFFQLLTIINIM